MTRSIRAILLCLLLGASVCGCGVVSRLKYEAGDRSCARFAAAMKASKTVYVEIVQDIPPDKYRGHKPDEELKAALPILREFVGQAVGYTHLKEVDSPAGGDVQIRVTVRGDLLVGEYSRVDSYSVRSSERTGMATGRQIIGEIVTTHRSGPTSRGWFSIVMACPRTIPLDYKTSMTEVCRSRKARMKVQEAVFSTLVAPAVIYSHLLIYDPDAVKTLWTEGDAFQREMAEQIIKRSSPRWSKGRVWAGKDLTGWLETQKAQGG